MTAKEATKDLPVLGDGHVLACIPFPDHRKHTRQRALIRVIMKLIPTTPPGMNLVRTAQRYLIPVPVREYLSRQHPLRIGENSNSLSRLIGDGLFPTVVTKLSPEDAKAGRGIHWSEPRTQTLMEARLAQGFLDHEPLIGVPATKWKIVGDSVARSVSLALGMSLREAWLGNLEHLIRRVTSRRPKDPNMQEQSSKEVGSNVKPIVLISINLSFDRSEYDSYDNCEIDSEDWTDAEADLSTDELAMFSEPASLTGEECVEALTEPEKIIDDIRGSLLAEEDSGDTAEAVAQEEVAIDLIDPLACPFEVWEDPDRH